MINKILITLAMIVFINNAFSGTTLVGTRFIYNNEDNLLNIKIINDENVDYLIKSELDDKSFIITPPLFILKKTAVVL
ncbi:fimbria/pilus periplasmic chaperone [Providencia rettgeri]|uniref:fimbria/pilus periplasmic chaperone n=1 Tax=Providencia rettgeri TaxID=587 RepID=UPI0021D586C5|nr:fimbria/pilus periplasmic chaperone [Providencia rettgeri]